MIEKKTMKILISLLIIGIILISGCIRGPETKNGLEQKFTEFKTQHDWKKTQGYNITDAEEFARKAKQFFDGADYNAANESLDDAFEALENAEKISDLPEAVKEDAKNKLSAVEVAVLYERVTDGAVIGRSVGDVITTLDDMKTDFIFRGFWRWYICPESHETASDPIYIDDAVKRGYTYEQLSEAISQIKEEMPNVIFCGSIPAQRINSIERNPITDEILGEDQTWEMALDPEKWDIDMSKEEFQERFGKRVVWEGREAYFPDITNPEFQELITSWAKKQIDCGADAIWIDMLFKQAWIFKQMTGDPYHPAVKESFDASSKIVDEIHNYGDSKGKYVYVGSWSTAVKFPHSPPNLDFVTESPSPQEIANKEFDEEKWMNNTKTEVEEKLGDIPIFVFIDWSSRDDSPLATFSQKLSIYEQNEMLKKTEQFFQEVEMIFVYPIHGGTMGTKSTNLSFGKYTVYDSLAPEFDTYDTLMGLAQTK